MAYATGSGTYTALMAAVLSFAIADGWTASGGANWPISKGNVRGVDWNTFTATEVDHTGNAGASVTVRYIRIAVGTSLANATANAALTANSAVMANAHYTFSNWWIFSDSGAGKPNYISVVVQFSNGVNSDCFAHFSFGELDKHGMTHTATVFATASTNRAYASDITATATGNQSFDYNSGPYGRVYKPYTGSAAFLTYTSAFNQNNLVLIVDPTVNPIPVAGSFPAADTIIPSSLILDLIKNNDSNVADISSIRSTALAFNLCSWAWMARPQPFSGAVTLVPLPVILLNNVTTSAQMVMLGSFPNVRIGSMDSYAPADEVVYASETWKMFPMLRNTTFSAMQDAGVISSGRVSFVHKKVI